MYLGFGRFSLSAKKFSGFVCLVTVSSLTAFADTNISPVAVEATNEVNRLPTITVLAPKEPANEQSLPISVTAVTRTTIEEADVTTVKQASIYAPNVFINEFTARAVSNPFFRGIGGSPGNPGVTTFIDG